MPAKKVTGIAIGPGKGHITTKMGPRVTKKGKVLIKPSQRRGVLGKRVKLVRDTIKEVVGFAPYEKRIMELLKTGVAKDSKKALKLAKARLGTHHRALAKREDLENTIRHRKK